MVTFLLVYLLENVIYSQKIGKQRQIAGIVGVTYGIKTFRNNTSRRPGVTYGIKTCSSDNSHRLGIT